MNETEIINIISGYINDALTGMSKESPKLDFKSKWYDLTLECDINEFIKDSSSIANTPGLDGFIVVGFDDKKRTFNDSVFADSKLKDTNELVGILIKRVDKNYNISHYDIEVNGHKLSILHIPPSFDKPHVIKNYKYKNGREEQHRVFVRYGSTTKIASKCDLDFIAYDRKNNIPEYSLFISSSKNSISPLHTPTKRVVLNVGLTIENNGLRPVAIAEIILVLFYDTDSASFISHTNAAETFDKRISVNNIIVQPASIKALPGLVFIAEEGMTDSEFKEYQNSYSSFNSVGIKIKLNTGYVIDTKVQLI